jgi:hypothetical protein
MTREVHFRGVDAMNGKKQELTFEDIWTLVQGGSIVKNSVELKISIVQDPDLHAHIDTLKNGARRIRLVKNSAKKK